MKVRVKIDGFIDVPDGFTEKDIEDAVYFSLGMGSISVDNPVEYPDWVNADVDISM